MKVLLSILEVLDSDGEDRHAYEYVERLKGTCLRFEFEGAPKTASYSNSLFVSYRSQNMGRDSVVRAVDTHHGRGKSISTI
jgi:hypothetical protein